MKYLNDIFFFFSTFGIERIFAIIGFAFIVIIPTALFFLAIGYHTRKVMEPERVIKAIAEARESRLSYNSLILKLEHTLVLLNKADIKEREVQTGLRGVESLRQLAMFKLLGGRH